MGKPWKSRFVSRRVGPGGDGSLPSLRGKPAPLSLCHLQRSMAAVCFPTADIYLLQMQARQKAVSIIFCWERHGSWKRPSRTTRPQWRWGTADCTSVPDNVYIYRKHVGQRGYKGHVLNLPQDIQGFLNSLPANMSDLPILVIRKQGAGESLK